jgi:Tannase and feruloyl esterase
MKRHAIAMLLALAAGGCANGGAPRAPVAIRQCESLAGMTVAASAIGLPTRGATVRTAERAAAVAPYQDAEGERLLPTPERCLVQGDIAPIDPAAPPIRFAINLPLTNWNGRALHSGGGGLNGVVITAPGNKASGRFDPNPLDRPHPVTQGYATFGSDGGHVNTEYKWAYNDEAVRNWAHEELKKTHDVALAVIRAAYGSAPTHVFFSGESAGGREAIIVAQRYPDDYDGVIATSSVILWNGVHIYDNRLRDRLIDGFLDAAAIKLVADRTRASCDAADGLQDNVVGRYLECRNDVAALQCASGQTSGCLTEAQAGAVNALREPWRYPFPLTNGITTFPGFGTTGDEDGKAWQWPFYPVGTVAPSAALPPGRGFEQGRGAILNFAAFWVRHLIVQKEDFNPRGFDVGPFAQRARHLSELYDATDPDLSRFAAHGGKLILVHPSADNATPLTVSADYYGSVVSRLGQLENWVLRGMAPPDVAVAYERRVTDNELFGPGPPVDTPTIPTTTGREARTGPRASHAGRARN